MLFATDSTDGPRWCKETSCFGFGKKRVVDWWKNLPQTAQKYGYAFTREEVELMLGGNSSRILGIEKKPEYEMEHKYGFRLRSPSPFPY